jgi:ABC-type transport system involved in multi-copper enzyme maturation permease subunit
MQKRKIWIGRWLIFVAIGHTVVGLMFGTPVLLKMLERGLFNSVGSEPVTGMFTWFFLFGAVLALLGMAIHAIERSDSLASTRALGIGLMLLTVLGVVLMPVSGFWLAFPAAIALLRR